jgi:hypothetical protein
MMTFQLHSLSRRSVALWLLSGLLCTGCGDDAPSLDADVLVDSGADSAGVDAEAADAGSTDAESEDTDATPDATDADAAEPNADAGEPDAASDASTDARDADSGEDVSPMDVGEDVEVSDADTEDVDSGEWPLAGFGELTGDCNQLDDELLSGAPYVFSNTIDFGDDPFERDVDDGRLTPDGRAMLAAGNAGGSSLYSELFALETLVRCEGAVLLETETTIVYDEVGSITDFLVSIDDRNIGVSVVRAFRFPPEGEYTVEQAAHVLRGKLTDILESSANVNEAFAWEKQILHVVAYSDRYADSVRAALPTLPSEVLADTIVMITTTNGDDDPIY